MEVGIGEQLIKMLLSLAVGSSLGILYDFFRVLRRNLGTDLPFDLIYAAAVLTALFVQGMSVGGGMSLVAATAFSVAAYVLYMALLSKAFLSLFQQVAAILSIIFSPLKTVVKKFAVSLKNVFSNRLSGFTIKRKSKCDRGGDAFEIETAADRRSGDSGTAPLCGDKSCENDGFTERCFGDDGAFKVRHRGSEKGKR